MDVDTSQYKVGIVEDVQQLSGKLRICRVNIGQDDLITVVTSSTNVRQGSRAAVATVGCTFLDDGISQTVRKQSIGGVLSEGIFCDSYMLGWTGGARGVVAQIPEEFELGTAPPISKPRKIDEASINVMEPTTAVVGLFEKKLSKEMRKKLAEERRNSRKALKSSKIKGGKDADLEDDLEEQNGD